MTHVAVLGLGRMGTAVGQRLLDTGHRVTVYNRTAGRVRPLGEAGATAAPTPASAATHADIVVCMLADEDAVTAVLTGPGGVAEGVHPGTCLVQMSTVGPEAMQAVAARLPAGVPVIDAPVIGSVPHARQGRLTVLAGGEPDSLDHADPLLANLGQVQRCGRLGTASAVKLVANHSMLTALASVAESLRLAEVLGVSEQAGELLAGGPLAGVVARSRDTESRFPLALAAKDLALAADTSRRPTPVADAAGVWLSDAVAVHGEQPDVSAAFGVPGANH